MRKHKTRAPGLNQIQPVGLERLIIFIILYHVMFIIMPLLDYTMNVMFDRSTLG